MACVKAIMLNEWLSGYFQGVLATLKILKGTDKHRSLHLASSCL